LKLQWRQMKARREEQLSARVAKLPGQRNEVREATEAFNEMKREADEVILPYQQRVNAYKAERARLDRAISRVTAESKRATPSPRPTPTGISCWSS
jgi:hypothetical protein